MLNVELFCEPSNSKITIQNSKLASPMHRETVFIGFGSNVGDRIDFCDRAVTLLSLLPHSQVVGVSLLYESEPVNDHAQPGDGWFLNGVVQLETDVTPKSLLAILREIERSLGRDEEDRSGPRTIDRKSTRLNSSHVAISYAVFCLKKKK